MISPRSGGIGQYEKFSPYFGSVLGNIKRYRLMQVGYWAIIDYRLVQVAQRRYDKLSPCPGSVLGCMIRIITHLQPLPYLMMNNPFHT